MAKINQRIKKRLGLICNQFIEEQIGSAKLNLMPPKDKVPIISRMRYDKDGDAFEIYFSECENCVCKSKNNIDFLEDRSGHLMAIRIKGFSSLDVDNIELDVYTTIENEIQRVSMELYSKKDIPDNVIDKRKLMFLDTVVKNDYKELKRAYVN